MRHALMIFQMWNGAWNKLQFKVYQATHGSVAYLDKHSTLVPVMVSVVSSNATEGNFLNFLKLLDVNSGLKCKCDLIVKNSNNFDLDTLLATFAIYPELFIYSTKRSLNLMCSPKYAFK